MKERCANWKRQKQSESPLFSTNCRDFVDPDLRAAETQISQPIGLDARNAVSPASEVFPGLPSGLECPCSCSVDRCEADQRRAPEEAGLAPTHAPNKTPETLWRRRTAQTFDAIGLKRTLRTETVKGSRFRWGRSSPAADFAIQQPLSAVFDFNCTSAFEFILARGLSLLSAVIPSPEAFALSETIICVYSRDWWKSSYGPGLRKWLGAEPIGKPHVHLKRCVIQVREVEHLRDGRPACWRKHCFVRRLRA
jgi:hypothetical protein